MGTPYLLNIHVWANEIMRVVGSDNHTCLLGKALRPYST